MTRLSIQFIVAFLDSFFLDAPRYTAGVFGFLTTPAFGRRIVQMGGVMSVVTLLLAAGVYWAGPQHAKLSGPMFVLVGTAWCGIFGLMRLFVTGAMWAVGVVCSAVEDAAPSLTGPCQFVHRAYWVIWEVILIGLFYSFLGLACSLPFLGVSATIS